MKWLKLMVILTYVVSASDYVPNACKPFEKMNIQKVINSKYKYAGSCKVLYKQLQNAQKTQMPQKALFFGYALQTLEDLERFGIKTNENKAVIESIFDEMNINMVATNMIEKSDTTTVYKGLLLGENKVYRLYFEDYRLKVIKENMSHRQDGISIEKQLIVDTKGGCLTARVEPYKEATQIKCIKNKSQLVTIPTSNAFNGYIKVQFMGGTGWVSKAYTKSNEE